MTQQKLEVTLKTWNLGLFTHIAFDIQVPNCSYEFDTMSPGLDRVPSASFSFELEGNIQEIQDWWFYSQSGYDIFSNNCADTTQAFLVKFAQVPNPQPFAPPYTFNHLSLGICLPSFLPIGITLPGRILDHAKFYLEPRLHPKILQHLHPSDLKLSMALAFTLMVGSVLGLIAAASFLSGILLALTIPSAVILGSMASMHFFGSMNKLAMHIQNAAHQQPALSRENC